MTDAEQFQWCSDLAKTPRQQRLVLIDLLRHANEDEMSADDRRICARQLQRIEREIGRHG